MNWDSWKENIEDFLIRTIDVSRKYYFDGAMKEIRLSVSLLYYDVNITILTDDSEYEVDYENFKMASEGNERDKQRECYFEHESIWAEFFLEFDDDADIIQDYLLQVCNELKERYNVKVLLEMEADDGITI